MMATRARNTFPRGTFLAFTLVLALLPAIVAADQRIDINQANATDLATALHGVGPALADAIINERESNGPFRSAEGLTRVRGIGPVVVERNQDRITVAPNP